MKHRYNAQQPSSVAVCLAFLAKDYTRYGFEAEVQDKAITPKFIERHPFAGRLGDNQAACVAARDNLIKRVKRRALKNSQMYVIVTTQSVSGRAHDYLIKRGEATINLAWIDVVKEGDAQTPKARYMNEHVEVTNYPQPSTHRREIDLAEVAQKVGVNKTDLKRAIKALRMFDDPRQGHGSHDYFFSIPIGEWNQIPLFDKLGLVNKIQCRCEPDNETSYNSDCPICSHRSLEGLIDCLDEFIGNPEYHFDRSEQEIKQLNGNYGLLDLMGYEYNNGDFGAYWDCVSGCWHDSMWSIVYRVESTLSAGAVGGGVSIDNLREYSDELKRCVTLSERGLRSFKVADVDHLQDDENGVYQR
jgi:hypothetical protein